MKPKKKEPLTPFHFRTRSKKLILAIARESEKQGRSTANMLERKLLEAFKLA